MLLRSVAFLWFWPRLAHVLSMALRACRLLGVTSFLTVVVLRSLSALSALSVFLWCGVELCWVRGVLWGVLAGGLVARLRRVGAVIWWVASVCS